LSIRDTLDSARRFHARTIENKSALPSLKLRYTDGSAIVSICPVAADAYLPSAEGTGKKVPVSAVLFCSI